MMKCEASAVVCGTADPGVWKASLLYLLVELLDFLLLSGCQQILHICCRLVIVVVIFVYGRRRHVVLFFVGPAVTKWSS